MNAVVHDVKGREVAQVAASQVAPVGTFTVRRALPLRDRHAVGPWVFLDHFGPFRVKPGEDGVGPHPHSGIETVTYLLSGRMQHRDSAGHLGVVAKGGAQWMTSGRGIVHSERPLAENEAELTMHGIQLWTTLPRSKKLMPPRYQRIDAESIPAVAFAGGTVRVIAGEFAGTAGPAETQMPLFLWHVSLAPGASFESTIPACHEAAAYVIEGEADLGDSGEESAVTGRIAIFDGTEERVRIANASASAKLEVLLLGGAPAEGPLVFHGPFVMNSVEQIRAAEIAYHTGRMGQLSET